MLLFSIANRSARISIAVLLIVAMLCAHWAGLVHSVVHAKGTAATSPGWGHASAIAAISAPVQEHHGAASASEVSDNQGGSIEDTHFCSLFDAATLGSSIHSTPFQVVQLPSARLFALWAAFASWQSPFACHFSSRAPPRA